MLKSQDMRVSAKATSKHLIHVGIATLTTVLIVSCMYSACQYGLANAQEDQSGGLQSYVNEQLGIQFEYPGFLVANNVPGGVVLVPASEGNSQQHSLTIFVLKLSQKGSQENPQQLLQQLFTAQDIHEINDVLPIVFTTADGQNGHVGIGNFGAKGTQEVFLYGFTIPGDTSISQYINPLRVVLNHMELGHTSKATMQKANQVANQIEQLKMNTMSTIINNIGR